MKDIINQKMETSISWYSYYLPQMICSNYSIFPTQFGSFQFVTTDFDKINLIPYHNWLGLFCTKKENFTQINHQFKPIAIKTPGDEENEKNSQKELIRKQNRKHEKKYLQEGNQYLPNSKTHEKQPFNACLNEYRNILPNTIHQILSYIQRKNKSKSIVEKLIRKYQLQQSECCLGDPFSNDLQSQKISITRFYAYQNNLKNRLSNYVKLQTFKFLCSDQNIEFDSRVFSVNEQRIYNKICRTAILYYLKYEVVCVIMSSRRMQKDKKREHLRVNRQIEQYIKSGFKKEMEQDF